MKPLKSAAMYIMVVLSLSVVSEGRGQVQTGFRLLSQQVTIVLKADGRFSQTTVAVSENIGTGPLTHYAFASSDNKLTSVFDGDGHALDYTVRKEGNVFRFRVTLRQPAESGERIKLRLVDRDAEVYLGKNGVHAYGKTHYPGAEIDYEEKIIVDPGLRLILCEPDPARVSIRDGKTVLTYTTHLQADQPFKCRILYQVDESGVSEEDQAPTPDGADESKKTYFYGIEINGVLCGHSRVDLRLADPNGQAYHLMEQRTALSLAILGRDIQQRQRFTYHIDPETGNFSYHDSYIEQGETRMSNAVTVGNDTLRIQSSDGAEEKLIPLAEDVILPNTLIFSHLRRDFGERGMDRAVYPVYNPRLGQVQDAVYTKTGETTLTLAGRSYEAIGLTFPGPAMGGQTELWIDAATGVRLKAIMANQLTMTLTDSAVVDRAGTYDYDKDFFIRTNRHIPEIRSISHMETEVTLGPAPGISRSDLNCPGQRFAGTVEEGVIDGVFNVSHSRYEGKNAPVFPDRSERDPELDQYLRPGIRIESDDPVLSGKAEEITAGSGNRWDAACRIARWVGDNISGLASGSARETYDSRKGLCGEKSLLTAAFCRAVGIPARVVWGYMYTLEYGGSFGQHAWNEVYMDSAGWIPLDATIGEYDYVDSGHIRLGILVKPGIRIDEGRIQILDYGTSDL
jgi:transglutaminase-like putative cysteine protease